MVPKVATLIPKEAAGPRAARPREGLRLQQLGKRTLDIIISALGIILLVPAFIILWLAIRLDSPGPAIFRQRRVGRSEKLFTCLKFRTLYRNANEEVHRQAIRRLWVGERLSDDPNSPYKLTNDSRVTRVGHWLRRTSLDELPQLLNVLRGEMSLVGPRPIVQDEIARYADDIDYYYETKPGLTGLWQVSGRSDTSYARRVRLDVWYVRNWTLWHDIAILLKTIPAVFLQRGAQ